MRIKDLLSVSKVVSSGFPAVEGLGEYSNKEGNEIVLSTLPASVLAEKGVELYVAPRFERGQVFETTEDIIEANIPIDAYRIVTDFTPAELRSLTKRDNTIIVSRHQGTIDILTTMYPTAKVFDGNVSADDIAGKHVIGTLPPFLITECGIYTPVTIKDFDYNKDGDIRGEELEDCLIIGDPFSLIKQEVSFPDLSSEQGIKEFFRDSEYSGYTRKYADLSLLGGAIYQEVELEDVLKNLGYNVKYISFSDMGAEVAITIAVKDDEVMTFKHSFY